MATTKYVNCGSSALILTGHKESCRPGQIVEHDFAIDGPDGEHGPARLAALIESGALKPADTQPTRRAAAEPKE